MTPRGGGHPAAEAPACAAVLRAGVAYFALVFAAGFALGAVRVLLVAPAIGERWAEIGETPLMLAVIWFAARASLRRRRVAARAWSRFAIGALALACMLAAETLVALVLRGQAPDAWLASRDPLALVAYAAGLLWLLLAPLVVLRGGKG